MKPTVLSVLAALCIATLLSGQFPGGITVFDPAVFGKNVEELAQLEQQLTEMLQTYQMVTRQYQQMLWMARTVPARMAARYRAILTPWKSFAAPDTYGTTAGWVRAVNTGINVAAGYQGSSEELQAYGAALNLIPADQWDRLEKHYATVELSDGASQTAMETIGTLRRNGPAVETAIEGLEEDSLSSDPAFNTEVALLNKINAAGVIALRNGQDTNKLLVTLAEQQLVAAKRQRDAEVRAINTHIAMISQGRQILRDQSAHWTEAMLAYRP